MTRYAPAVLVVAVLGTVTGVAAQALPSTVSAPTHVVYLRQGLLGGSVADSTTTRSVTDSVVAQVRRAGVAVTHEYDALGAFAATLTPAQVAQLHADPAIAAVTPNGVRHAPILVPGEARQTPPAPWPTRPPRPTQPPAPWPTHPGRPTPTAPAPTAPTPTWPTPTPSVPSQPQPPAPTAPSGTVQEQRPASWNLDRIDAKALPLGGSYRYSRTGKGVRVFVLDSGIRATHTDLVGRVASTGYDGINDGKGTGDCFGHGTAMASIIAGTTYGVAKQAELVPVRVFDCRGDSTDAGYLGGLNYVLSNVKPGDLVNSSLGGLTNAGETSDEKIFKQIVAKGATVVASAGNDRTDACRNSPGRLPELVTVASSDVRDQFDRQISNYGTCVDLFAPGVNIPSAWYKSDTDTKTNSGTSTAAPHVTGALALFLEGNRTATQEERVRWLLSNASSGVLSGLPAGSPNLLLHTAP